MDTHISELAREQYPPENRVRPRVSLPGEAGTRRPPPHEPLVLGQGEATVTVDPAERLTAASPPRQRRRTWLLATAAVVVVAAVGAGFLLSPYNTILYPADAARLRTQGQTLASAASAAVADLVAPSARVARAPQPVQLPLAERQVVAIPSSDDQMREILALRDRTRGGSGVADGPARPPAAAPFPAPPAIAPQAAPPSLAATSPVALSPPAAPPAPPPPVLAPIPATGPQAIPATAAARQPDPLRTPSLPPLAVFETGATPASSPGATSAVAPRQAFPNVTEAQSRATAAPTPPAPPPAVPVAASAIDANPPSGQGFEPAAPIDPIPAPAPHVAPTQPAPVIAMITQQVRAAPTARPLSTPSEVVGAAVELRAAPMTPAQQIEVLNLVTKLGVVVRDMRAENAALKSRVESTADRFDAAVTDFDRRLALAEAKGAVNAAMGGDAQGSNGASRWNGVGGGDAVPTAPAVGMASEEETQGSNGNSRRDSVAGSSPAFIVSSPETAVSNPTRSARAGAGTGSGVQIIPVSNTAAAGGSAAPRYRVTAASPGLAMLSLLDRSGGEGSQLQVAVGDQVPGYGRVTAIQQRGSAWIVQTDKGPDKGVIQ